MEFTQKTGLVTWARIEPGQYTLDKASRNAGEKGPDFDAAELAKATLRSSDALFRVPVPQPGFFRAGDTVTVGYLDGKAFSYKNHTSGETCHFYLAYGVHKFWGRLNWLFVLAITTIFIMFEPAVWFFAALSSYIAGDLFRMMMRGPAMRYLGTEATKLFDKGEAEAQRLTARQTLNVDKTLGEIGPALRQPGRRAVGTSGR